MSSIAQICTQIRKCVSPLLTLTSVDNIALAPWEGRSSLLPNSYHIEILDRAFNIRNVKINEVYIQ